ncbi:antibiotic biosynthesis monooxygenase family protein [Dermatophilaceae bacterium Sec6.4]
MLIVAGYLEVSFDVRDVYLSAVLEVTRLARDAPGCLEFVQAADPLMHDRVIVYERWESQEHLLAFRDTDPGPNVTPFPDIRGAEVMRYEISTVGLP